MARAGKRARWGAAFGVGLTALALIALARGMPVLLLDVQGDLSKAPGLTDLPCEVSDPTVAPGADADGGDVAGDGGAPAAGEGLAVGTVHGWADAQALGGSVTNFALCGTAGVLVDAASNALGVRATWEVEAGVVECARDVLEEYEAADVALQHDGYIDLFGRVWGCTVWSDEGWSEVVVVDGRQAATGDGSGRDAPCLLTVARFGCADRAAIQGEA